MTYWISLHDENNEILPVPRFVEGGTYAIGGSEEADLNVTYNYANSFDFRGLQGRTGAETESELSEVVARLGDNPDPDYWADTPGNAGHACVILWRWTQLHPQGRWNVN